MADDPISEEDHQNEDLDSEHDNEATGENLAYTSKTIEFIEYQDDIKYSTNSQKLFEREDNTKLMEISNDELNLKKLDNMSFVDCIQEYHPMDNYKDQNGKHVIEMAKYTSHPICLRVDDCKIKMVDMKSKMISKPKYSIAPDGIIPNSAIRKELNKPCYIRTLPKKVQKEDTLKDTLDLVLSKYMPEELLVEKTNVTSENIKEVVRASKKATFRISSKAKAEMQAKINEELSHLPDGVSDKTSAESEMGQMEANQKYDLNKLLLEETNSIYSANISDNKNKLRNSKLTKLNKATVKQEVEDRARERVKAKQDKIQQRIDKNSLKMKETTSEVEIPNDNGVVDEIEKTLRITILDAPKNTNVQSEQIIDLLEELNEAIEILIDKIGKNQLYVDIYQITVGNVSIFDKLNQILDASEKLLPTLHQIAKFIVTSDEHMFNYIAANLPKADIQLIQTVLINIDSKYGDREELESSQELISNLLGGNTEMINCLFRLAQVLETSVNKLHRASKLHDDILYDCLYKCFENSEPALKKLRLIVGSAEKAKELLELIKSFKEQEINDMEMQPKIKDKQLLIDIDTLMEETPSFLATSDNLEIFDQEPNLNTEEIVNKRQSTIQQKGFIIPPKELTSTKLSPETRKTEKRGKDVRQPSNEVPKNLKLNVVKSDPKSQKSPKLPKTNPKPDLFNKVEKEKNIKTNNQDISPTKEKFQLDDVLESFYDRVVMSDWWPANLECNNDKTTIFKVLIKLFQISLTPSHNDQISDKIEEFLECFTLEEQILKKARNSIQQYTLSQIGQFRAAKAAENKDKKSFHCKLALNGFRVMKGLGLNTDQDKGAFLSEVTGVNANEKKELKYPKKPLLKRKIKEALKKEDLKKEDLKREDLKKADLKRVDFKREDLKTEDLKEEELLNEVTNYQPDIATIGIELLKTSITDLNISKDPVDKAIADHLTKKYEKKAMSKSIKERKVSLEKKSHKKEIDKKQDVFSKERITIIGTKPHVDTVSVKIRDSKVTRKSNKSMTRIHKAKSVKNVVEKSSVTHKLPYSITNLELPSVLNNTDIYVSTDLTTTSAISSIPFTQSAKVTHKIPDSSEETLSINEKDPNLLTRKDIFAPEHVVNEFPIPFENLAETTIEKINESKIHITNSTLSGLHEKEQLTNLIENEPLLLTKGLTDYSEKQDSSLIKAKELAPDLSIKIAPIETELSSNILQTVQDSNKEKDLIGKQHIKKKDFRQSIKDSSIPEKNETLKVTAIPIPKTQSLKAKYHNKNDFIVESEISKGISQKNTPINIKTAIQTKLSVSKDLNLSTKSVVLKDKKTVQPNTLGAKMISDARTKGKLPENVKPNKQLKHPTVSEKLPLNNALLEEMKIDENIIINGKDEVQTQHRQLIESTAKDNNQEIIKSHQYSINHPIETTNQLDSVVSKMKPEVIKSLHHSINHPIKTTNQPASKISKNRPEVKGHLDYKEQKLRKDKLKEMLSSLEKVTENMHEDDEDKEITPTEETQTVKKETDELLKLHNTMSVVTEILTEFDTVDEGIDLKLRNQMLEYKTTSSQSSQTGLMHTTRDILLQVSLTDPSFLSKLESIETRVINDWKQKINDETVDKTIKKNSYEAAIQLSSIIKDVLNVSEEFDHKTQNALSYMPQLKSYGETQSKPKLLKQMDTISSISDEKEQYTSEIVHQPTSFETKVYPQHTEATNVLLQQISGTSIGLSNDALNYKRIVEEIMKQKEERGNLRKDENEYWSLITVLSNITENLDDDSAKLIIDSVMARSFGELIKDTRELVTESLEKHLIPLSITRCFSNITLLKSYGVDDLSDFEAIVDKFKESYPSETDQSKYQLPVISSASMSKNQLKIDPNLNFLRNAADLGRVDEQKGVEMGLIKSEEKTKNLAWLWDIQDEDQNIDKSIVNLDNEVKKKLLDDYGRKWGLKNKLIDMGYSCDDSTKKKKKRTDVDEIKNYHDFMKTMQSESSGKLNKLMTRHPILKDLIHLEAPQSINKPKHPEKPVRKWSLKHKLKIKKIDTINDDASNQSESSLCKEVLEDSEETSNTVEDKNIGTLFKNHLKDEIYKEYPHLNKTDILGITGKPKKNNLKDRLMSKELKEMKRLYGSNATSLPFVGYSKNESGKVLDQSLRSLHFDMGPGNLIKALIDNMNIEKDQTKGLSSRISSRLNKKIINSDYLKSCHLRPRPSAIPISEWSRFAPENIRRNLHPNKFREIYPNATEHCMHHYFTKNRLHQYGISVPNHIDRYNLIDCVSRTLQESAYTRIQHSLLKCLVEVLES